MSTYAVAGSTYDTVSSSPSPSEHGTRGLVPNNGIIVPNMGRDAGVVHPSSSASAADAVRIFGYPEEGSFCVDSRGDKGVGGERGPGGDVGNIVMDERDDGGDINGRDGRGNMNCRDRINDCVGSSSGELRERRNEEEKGRMGASEQQI